MRAIRFQRGLTIAELLVAMTLGLAVSLGVATLLLGASGAYLAQAQASAADEAGRQAIEAVGRAVRLAAPGEGESSAGGPEPAAPASVVGLDDHILGRAGADIAKARAGGYNGSDVLAVRFRGAGPPPDGDGSVTGCAGFSVHAQEDGWSIFYVASGSGGAELRCKYRGARGWGADALVGGVDGFQVLYGLDTDGDGLANRYVSASTVTALDAAIVPAGGTSAERARDLRGRTHWKRVRSVKVALLLDAGRAGDEAEPERYDLLGPLYGDARAAADRGARLYSAALAGGGPARTRRLFQATFAVPAMP